MCGAAGLAVSVHEVAAAPARHRLLAASSCGGTKLCSLLAKI